MIYHYTFLTYFNIVKIADENNGIKFTSKKNAFVIKELDVVRKKLIQIQLRGIINLFMKFEHKVVHKYPDLTEKVNSWLNVMDELKDTQLSLLEVQMEKDFDKVIKFFPQINIKTKSETIINCLQET